MTRPQYLLLRKNNKKRKKKEDVESAAPLSLVRGAQAEVFSPTEADNKFVSNKTVSSPELISVTAEGTAGSTINPDLTGLLDYKDAIRILTDPSGPMVIPHSPSPHAGSGRIPNSAQTPPLSDAVRSADRDHSGLEADSVDGNLIPSI